MFKTMAKPCIYYRALRKMQWLLKRHLYRDSTGFRTDRVWPVEYGYLCWFSIHSQGEKIKTQHLLCIIIISWNLFSSTCCKSLRGNIFCYWDQDLGIHIQESCWQECWFYTTCTLLCLHVLHHSSYDLRWVIVNLCKQTITNKVGGNVMQASCLQELTRPRVLNRHPSS